VPGLAHTATCARFGASHFQGRDHEPMSSPKGNDDSEIFDVASGLDTLAVGSSPAQSFAILDAVMAQALGMAMFNAVNSQQNAAIVRSAALTLACTVLLSLPVSHLDEGQVKATKEALRMGAAPNSNEPEAAQAPAQEGRTGQPKAASPGVQDGTTSGTAHPPQVNAQEINAQVVNAQVVDAINQTQRAVMDPQVVLTSGAGKAFQSAAQSAAITVQDAADALRSISIIATTASGVAMAQFLATGDPKYLHGVTAAQEMIKVATADYANIGAAAETMLKGFPSG
jgi:hypothetical protein